MEVHNLMTINPDDKVNDDLNTIERVIGASRVVALGESSHFVDEFWKVRQRIFRYLYEHGGFNVFAMEFGFSEGFQLAKWIKGEGELNKLEEYSQAAAKWGAAKTMKWLRQFNLENGSDIQFAGIDIPEAGGTIMPALEPVYEYTLKVDPQVGETLKSVLGLGGHLSSLSSAKSIIKWNALSKNDQDKLYATLNRIYLRFKAFESEYVPLTNQYSFDVAIRQLESAIHTIYILQAMSEMTTGTGFPTDMSIREYFMANSIIWHLNHLEPNSRIVLFSHNNHIQRTPVKYGDYLTAYPMGYYLNKYLRDKYCPIGITTTDNHTPDMDLDSNSPVGFNVVDKMLDKPIEGSFENELVKNKYDKNASFTDLKNENNKSELEKINCIRSQSAYVTTKIDEAFDGIISLPKITLDETIGF